MINNLSEVTDNESITTLEIYPPRFKFLHFETNSILHNANNMSFHGFLLI